MCQAGGVSRELSFGQSAPEARAQQENGSSEGVQHVDSLVSWLGKAQSDPTRRPSVKLSGRWHISLEPPPLPPPIPVVGGCPPSPCGALPRDTIPCDAHPSLMSPVFAPPLSPRRALPHWDG